MILACDQCSRQYRVDKYPPGQHMRCLCGHGLTVPEPDPRAHQARMLHCADCGGPLHADATRCDYCGGTIDPQGRDYTLVCPKCFARLPQSARFCIECAQPIRPQEVVEREPSARQCPRCQTPLQARASEAIGFDECPGCLGLWLPAEAFKLVCENKVEEYRHNPLPSGGRGNVPVDPVSYIKCPDCGAVMNRQNYGRTSGVIIDQCSAHGVWLDNSELERIARYIAEGGLARARQHEAEDAERRARAASRQSSAAGGAWTAASVPTMGSGGLVGYSIFSVLGGLLE